MKIKKDKHDEGAVDEEEIAGVDGGIWQMTIKVEDSIRGTHGEVLEMVVSLERLCTNPQRDQ